MNLGRKNARLGLFLSLRCPSLPPLPSACNNLLQPAMEDGQALGGRGWYRHPLLSLLILSDHLPSTIALATPFCEETRRDSSRPTSLSLSPSRSQRYEFLRFITICPLSPPISRCTVSSIISHQRWKFHYRRRKSIPRE